MSCFPSLTFPKIEVKEPSTGITYNVLDTASSIVVQAGAICIGWFGWFDGDLLLNHLVGDDLAELAYKSILPAAVYRALRHMNSPNRNWIGHFYE